VVSDLSLKRFNVVVAFSRCFFRFNSFLTGSGECCRSSFTFFSELSRLVVELRLEVDVGLITLGDLLPD